MNNSYPNPNLDKPSLTWYEHAWLGLPLLLIFAGGMIGGACGGAAWAINQKVFQKLDGPLRYVITGLISAAAVLVYFAVVVTILSALGRRN